MIFKRQQLFSGDLSRSNKVDGMREIINYVVDSHRYFVSWSIKGTRLYSYEKYIPCKLKFNGVKSVFSDRDPFLIDQLEYYRKFAFSKISKDIRRYGSKSDKVSLKFLIFRIKLLRLLVKGKKWILLKR